MIGFVPIPEERMKLLKSNDKWKSDFSKLSDVKVNVNDEVELESDDPILLLRAKQVFVAFGRGFEFDDALNMLDEEFILDVIEIRNFTKSENRGIVLKGRIIGTGGKIRKLIEKYSNTKMAIYGKTVCIIGRWDEVRVARKVIEMLLSGSKHSSVMRYIQENKNL